jgi:methylmalonyl-CoA mutase
MKPAKDSNLFIDFPEISTNAWEEKIKADLKGADYQKKLYWNTDEGIRVKPFYRAEDLTSCEYLENLGSLKADQPEPNGWNICQDIWIRGNHEEANRRIRIALDGGAQSIRIHLEDQMPVKKEWLTHLMKDISLDGAEWIFKGPLSADSLLEALLALAKEEKTDLSALNLTLGADPLGRMTETGIPIASMENIGRLAERTDS